MTETETDTATNSGKDIVDAAANGAPAGANETKAKDSAPVAKHGDSRSSVALLALVIAVLAVGAAGWSALQLMTLQTITTQLSSEALRLDGLSRRVDNAVAMAERRDQTVADLASSLESGLSVIPDLSTRIRRAEEQLASMPGVNARSRSRWLQTEALYYLQIANVQASLAGNAQVAASALQLADDKLRDMADPALNPVRARLSQDLLALQALPRIDSTGIAYRLQALGSQAGQWQFRSTAPSRFTPDSLLGRPADIQPDAWERFVATVKDVFGSIVSIKETDARPAAQLGSAEQALIVEAIRAELQIARLALVSGNAELFGQSLKRANEQVNLYFDTGSASVSAALITLGELQQLELPGDLPDISGSLTLLLAIIGDANSETGGGES